MTETKPNTRKLHPLYTEYISHIIETHDKVFENFKTKSPVIKISRLFNALTKDHEEGEVECQICKLYKRNSIIQHVNISHGLSGKEYKKLYNAELVSDGIKEYSSEKIKGDKNPGWQHGGRLSPFSEKFVKYQGKPKEEISESLRELYEKVGSSNKENGNNNKTIIYWTSRGYSEGDAKKELSKRGITFSLETCIEKHGEEIGRKLWLERQEKWQKTMKSKPIEEIERINRDKSTGRMCQLFNSNPEVKLIPSLLYYVRFFNDDNSVEFWKVGITSHDQVSKRFPSIKRYGLQYEIISTNINMNFYDAFKAEQNFLHKYKEHRINIDYNGFTTTESFSINVLNNQIL